MFKDLYNLIEFVRISITYINPHTSTIFRTYPSTICRSYGAGGVGITPITSEKFASLHTIVYFTGQALIVEIIILCGFVFNLR